MPSFTILLREEGTKGGRNGETRPSTHLASCPPFEIEAKLFGISTVFIGYCHYHLVTHISDIVTILPITKANISTVPLLPRDYLLVYLLDIVTVLLSSPR